DESIRGISSLEILKRVAAILREKGAAINNVDATLIAEAPKIGPHLSAIRTNLATALGLDISQIGVKATTNELLGSIGRGEGMAAMAIASVEI
ncbi:MAG: 2-C-methyl-D-erythritol 2,4-cyclodiphosphate synthase, partial [Chthoniobacteraceae bacterium]